MTMSSKHANAASGIAAISIAVSLLAWACAAEAITNKWGENFMLMYLWGILIFILPIQGIVAVTTSVIIHKKHIRIFKRHSKAFDILLIYGGWISTGFALFCGFQFAG